MTATLNPAHATGTTLLEARNLVKQFGGVRALDEMNISIAKGRVTALVGDNGAGKSTLVRCLTGVHAPDSGEVIFDGQPVHLSSPMASRALGIETVYQDLALVEDLTVWQNLFLNREETSFFGVLNRSKMKRRAAEILTDLDVNVPSIHTTVRRMSGGQRQSIAIARAVQWGTSMVIMDEPTAALGVRETAAVEKLVMGLRERGVTVLIISHDLAQVRRIAQDVVVLRRGRGVGSYPVDQVDGDRLVGLITGTITAESDTASGTGAAS